MGYAMPMRARAFEDRLAMALLAVALAWESGCADGPRTERDSGDSAAHSAGNTPADARGDANAEPEREPLEQYMARFDVEAPPPPEPPTAADAGSCPDKGQYDRSVGIMVGPRHAAARHEIRVMAATLEDEAPLALRVELDGEPVDVEMDLEYRTGVPAATVARFTLPEPGRATVVVGRDGEGLRCRTFNVRKSRFVDDSEVDLSMVWSNRRVWNAAEEALYSAWVRELFTGPVDEDLAWKSLTEVTSDPSRNLLHDHMGRGEDHPTLGMQLVPDCADTPYFLRAYWSYKRGLPFGFRKCSRGRGKPPSCFDLRTNVDPPDTRESWIDPNPPVVAVADPLAPEPEPHPNAKVPTTNEKIEYFFKRSIGWGVHTGNGRCAYGDSQSDLYPIRLDRRGLRPGIVYADPYGHILVLAELVAPRGSQPGVLFAVDGQPDGSITRKRFWEGNFLWNQSDESLGGSGFKAFRPLHVVGDPPNLVMQMDDETLEGLTSYGDVSDMQRELDALAFYDHMESLITPGVRSPFAAQQELVAALAEAVRVRVTSVDNGVAWHEDNPDDLVEMPWGHSVFETSGPWENYSTPARDLRLLIAMDVVLGFSAKVERNPAAFGLDPEGDPEGYARTLEYLEEQLKQLLADDAYRITYVRSDGSEWTLGLDEVVARAEAFEVAYNPNDCPEIRWGASEGTDEFSPCDRRAPEHHAIKMRYYRAWFRDRRRPARGDEGPEIPELAELRAAEDAEKK